MKTIFTYTFISKVSAALLTGLVAGTSACLAAVPLPGLVSYWQANGNGNDSAGSNPAILQGGATYGPGLLGQAFSFNGSTAVIDVSASSSLNVGLGSGFTISTWINPSKMTIQPLMEWNGLSGAYPWGVHMWMSVNNPSGLYANLVDTTGADHQIESSAGIITQGAWQQVALTYDKTSGTAVLYRDGVAVQTASLGSFTPQTSYDLYLGTRPAGAFSENHFQGLMDETSIYNRALTANEMLTLYQAVPEPGSMALICVGFIGLFGVSITRKHSTSRQSR